MVLWGPHAEVGHMRGRMVIVGSLGIAGIIAGGTPASAAPDQSTATKTPCWMVIKAIKPSIKTGHTKGARDVAGQAWTSNPGLCAGKTITVWAGYKTSKNGKWFEMGKMKQRMDVRRSYLGHANTYRCGTYVRSEYRIDGTTWEGKTSYKLC